jgi:hypothetical protein
MGGWWLALCVTLLVSSPAVAQWKDWDYDLDQEKKPWEELQTQLPPYPKPENLLKFDPGAVSSNSYFVDVASLSVGEDKVARYTLVVKSSGGATNVSFEGIRCDKGQLRVYAFGHANSAWSRARDSSWRQVVYREVNGHHYALYREYLCSKARSSEPLSVKQIIAAIKSGPAPALVGY